VYGLKRGEESIFADIFEDFAMPSYSNYPYPYAFDNYEEHFKIATILREMVEAIKSKSSWENCNRSRLQKNEHRTSNVQHRMLNGKR